MTSEKHVTLLIQRIKASHKNLNENPIFLEWMEQGEMRAKGLLPEDDFEEEFPATYGELFGLEKNQFPESELLSDDQKTRLFNAFYAMLASYGISINIPEHFTPAQAYPIAIRTLDDYAIYHYPGWITLDACNDDYHTCPYGEDCRCREDEEMFERNVVEAYELLLDISVACRELIKKFGVMELKIGNPSENEDNRMCMYIAAGSDFVPFEINHNYSDLEEAIQKIIYLFRNDIELVKLFENITPYHSFKNLEAFLSLKVEKLEGNTFYVEKYYIEDGLLHKGEAPTYTPEEFLDKLEAEDEDNKEQ